MRDETSLNTPLRGFCGHAQVCVRFCILVCVGVCVDDFSFAFVSTFAFTCALAFMFVFVPTFVLVFRSRLRSCFVCVSLAFGPHVAFGCISLCIRSCVHVDVVHVY